MQYDRFSGNQVRMPMIHQITQRKGHRRGPIVLPPSKGYQEETLNGSELSSLRKTSSLLACQCPLHLPKNRVPNRAIFESLAPKGRTRYFKGNLLLLQPINPAHSSTKTQSPKTTNFELSKVQINGKAREIFASHENAPQIKQILPRKPGEKK